MNSNSLSYTAWQTITITYNQGMNHYGNNCPPDSQEDKDRSRIKIDNTDREKIDGERSNLPLRINKNVAVSALPFIIDISL